MMTGREVVALAANEFGVALADVLSASRLPALVEVRHAAAWVLHNRSRAATSLAIAKVLGRRDHSTALHSIRQAEGKRLRDPTFAARLDALLVVAESDAALVVPFAVAGVDAPETPPRPPRTRIYDDKGASFTIDSDGFDRIENDFHAMLVRGSQRLVQAIERERAAA